MFDNQCYATTPSSSNGNSDQEPGGYGGGGGGQRRHQHHQHQQTSVTPTPGSPTSRLLLEYEMHLRNTLAKGMDAESYSLHTFEALLSQSMKNLGKTFSQQTLETLFSPPTPPKTRLSHFDPRQITQILHPSPPLFIIERENCEKLLKQLNLA